MGEEVERNLYQLHNSYHDNDENDDFPQSTMLIHILYPPNQISGTPWWTNYSRFNDWKLL